ncbi:transferase, partial [Streptomyces sp. NRRL F-6602]
VNALDRALRVALERIYPELVGNRIRMLVSDMAGRASIELKGKELGIDLGDDRALVGRVVERVKERELAGYSYEAADASFELLLRDELRRGADGAGDAAPSRFFRVESWRAITENRPDGIHANEATVKLWAKGERLLATAEGNGPVNALDRALRVALERIYPELAKFALRDYKVRILEGRSGTDST